MFRIGDFSRLTHVTVKALRHYDRLGLLTPAHTDPASGYRSYSGTQVSRLDRILALKDLGFSLEQIGRLLDADLSPDQLRGMLLAKQDEVRGRVAADTERLALIEARLAQISAGPANARYTVTLRQVAAQRVATIRDVLPAYPAVGALFGALHSYRRAHGLDARAWTAVWHDGAYRETDIHAEATFTTDDPLPPHPRIRTGTLPAVETMACVRYHGPPAAVGAAHRALLGWMEAYAYRLAGPTRTLPLHITGPDDADGVTEIQYPVARDAMTGRAPPPRAARSQRTDV